MKNYFKLFLSLLVVFSTSSLFVSCTLDEIKDAFGGGNDEEEDLNALKESNSPNLLKLYSGFTDLDVSVILSSEDVIPDAPDFIYGSLADGAGLLDNGDNTYTLINNIEGDYAIARIKLDKNLNPYHGEYILNATATASTAQCSGSLITQEEHGFGPLYLSGGEWGGSSKGVFLTDPMKDPADASTGEMLTAFGQWSTENAVVIGKDAYPGKTVAFIGDDHSDNSVPSGQLGMYVGNSGDLYGGKLYGLKVTSAGINYEVDMIEGMEYEAEFVELNEREINALDAEAKAKGVMGFSRLEDIDWRRGSAANQKEIYMAVTGRYKPDLVGKGSILGRIYKVSLNDSDPTGTCKISCVLDGDKIGGKAEGFHSPDNIVVTENFAYIQEDPNGYLDTSVNGFAKVYQYDLNSGSLKTVLEADQNKAAGLGYGSTSTNWEITGMIDVTDIVNNGENTFVLITQNHGWVPADGSAFTDPKANANVASSNREGSMLYIVKGLDR